MKNIIYISSIFLGLALLVSCNGGGKDHYNKVKVGSVSIKEASIAGAKRLAVASKTGAGTKALTKDGNEAMDALYKVSDDGKFIDVTYSFNIEVEEGEGEEARTVTQAVQASLRISPNFIFSVNDDFLWLANCYYYIPGYEEMSGGPIKDVLTTIRDEFNSSHHQSHGAHYLIRKSNGTMYEWAVSDGAPFGMADGYNPPTMLDSWFIPAGNKMYVREGGHATEHGEMSSTGRVICISDDGASLSFNDVIPASENVFHIIPGENGNLGVICKDGQYFAPKVYLSASSRLVPLTIPEALAAETAKWSIISIQGKLYAVRNLHHPDGTDDIHNSMGFYSILIADGAATVGSLVAEMEDAEVHWDSDQVMNGAATRTDTFTYIQDGSPAKLYTFDPKAATMGVRNLPAHYPAAKGWYINGIACNEASAQGFYVCDLSKDEAEYVALDWSDVSEYQSKVTSMTAEHFEAACMAVKYIATTSDGSKQTFWAPVTGSNAGKLILLNADDNGGYDINVLLNL